MSKNKSIMKTRQLAIIGVGIITSIALFVVFTFLLETKPHTEMKS
jgi:hypothetical protein